MGCVKELKTQDRYRVVAEEYVSVRKSGKIALIVSPTHAERDDVSNAVRSHLRERKFIKEKDRECIRLVSLGWTESQKKDAISYQAGQVVQFHKTARGFVAGDRSKILGSDQFGNVWVHGRAGPCILNRLQSDRFDVFQEKSIKIAAGDTIRFTRNGYALGKQRSLNNGTTYEVAGFVPLSGDIILKNGWLVRKDHGHFEYGYSVTSHSSQGKTVDVVLGVQSERSLGASSMEQFYVSMSRGKIACKLYTDNKAALLKRIQQSGQRTAAVDIFDRQERNRRNESHQKIETGRDRER